MLIFSRCFGWRSAGAARAGLALAAMGLSLSSLPGDAQACGACMVPSESAETVVSGHRMALSVSPAQTVLWDQLQYTGDPAEFAWVLPVKGDPKVEVAASAFFEVLEANTAVTVTSPQLDCPQGGCCFSGDDSAGGVYEPEEPGVTVVHQGTVGPYETVTLAATDPDALASYLTQHGYAVDPSARATFDAYVAEGFGFVALRLQPGKDVRQMVPIRVRSEGANLTLPLRGISVGAGANVPIVLYVIGAGRYTTQNFPEAQSRGRSSRGTTRPKAPTTPPCVRPRWRSRTDAASSRPMRAASSYAPTSRMHISRKRERTASSASTAPSRASSRTRRSWTPARTRSGGSAARWAPARPTCTSSAARAAATSRSRSSACARARPS